MTLSTENQLGREASRRKRPDEKLTRGETQRARSARPVALPPLEEEVGRASVYTAIRFLARLVIRWIYSGTSTGTERIPRTGPVILACTHQSYLDPILTATMTSRPQCFLARGSLFRVPGLGWLIRKLGAVPIERSSVSAREGLRIATRILERGRVLVMFPEGTRSPDGRLQPLKSGVAFVARRTGAPVVPALAAGTFAAWPRHRRLPRVAPVTLHVGRPLICDNRESFDSFIGRLGAAYRDLAREAGAESMLEPESGPGVDSSSAPTRRETPGAAGDDSAAFCATFVSARSERHRTSWRLIRS